jgi:transcriptional regulator
MRELHNYREDLEELSLDLVRSVGHTSTGALTHREVAMMAGKLGLEIVHVGDLPRSARSVTDLENGRIYLPPASIPGGHGLRSLALQAIAHQVLSHPVPKTYEEFLQQRLDINYFAAACLMPKTQALEFLHASKKSKNLAVEDFRDAFGVTHEAAG